MKHYLIEYYRSGIFRLWRWRVTADNGKVIGSSSEGYWNRKDCVDNAENLGKHLAANFQKND